jgi:hypothetical protein
MITLVSSQKSPTPNILARVYINHVDFFLFNRGDTSTTARLQTRKFGQAPILLFLTPRQALSSHPHVFVMILWESMNFHPVKQLFQVAGAGDRTAEPWVTSPMLPPYTTGTPHHVDLI